MPENPEGHEQIGSEFLVVQMALGPQESGIAHGSYPDLPDEGVEINTTEGMGVMGVVRGRVLTEMALVSSSSSSVSKSGILVVARNFGEKTFFGGVLTSDS